MASSPRESRRTLPNLFDWSDNLPDLFTWPVLGQRGIRIEEFIKDGQFVVRAEIPGLDPEKDISVNVDHGRLTIQADRKEERRESGRSEFHYGSFLRQVALPRGTDESQVRARYDSGILEVTLPVVEKDKEPRSVPIEHGNPE